MKSLNVMNFVRDIDERMENSQEVLFEVTKKELELVNEFGFKNTFLLQYDAVCDDNYKKLFDENNTGLTEIGLWYEIVEPLTTACGLPYRSENGWKWDWHIIPGFSMGYTVKERELLADEAMRKFREVYGYYPKTVASWLIDTHTINYLADNYDISTFAICRDQVSTDAYTLVGGYFNQAYYPSRCNVFTPAQTDEYRVNVPVFRLLGPCPVHNYENKKYLSDDIKTKLGCYTLEPVWHMGKTPEVVDWIFKTYYNNEDLGFSYAHVGQENSFGPEILPALRMQLEKVKALKDITIQTMSETGEAFKKLYPKKTPATSVVALDNWDTEDLQSVYYDCVNYSSNIFRYKNTVSVRAFYLFDEKIEDKYLKQVCTTYDAIYENMPLVDTLNCTDKDTKCGLILDEDAGEFSAEKTDDGVLQVCWNDKKVVFDEDKITIYAPEISFYMNNCKPEITVNGTTLLYQYKNNNYSLAIKGADIIPDKDRIKLISNNGKIELCPVRGK